MFYIIRIIILVISLFSLINAKKSMQKEVRISIQVIAIISIIINVFTMLFPIPMNWFWDADKVYSWDVGEVSEVTGGLYGVSVGGEVYSLDAVEVYSWYFDTFFFIRRYISFINFYLYGSTFVNIVLLIMIRKSKKIYPVNWKKPLLVCPKCGAPISENKKFCTNCGEKLNSI